MQRIKGQVGYQWVGAMALLGVLTIAACGGAVTHTQSAKTTATATAQLPTPSPTPLHLSDPQAQQEHTYAPRRLVIPKLQVNAAIVPVGVDAQGYMLAPVDAPPHDPIWTEVYWWDGGATPGQRGNAVIAGHVNRPTPDPAPFSNLVQLTYNDTVQIQTANGTVLTFVVVAIATPSAYEIGPNNPVLAEIFGPSTTPNLNLITCYGKYDGHTFDHRLVVTLRLVGMSPFTAGG